MSTMLSHIKLVSVNVGLPQTVTIGDQTIHTGIYKEPTQKRLYLTATGLEDDGQADRRVHGGPDKAVCVYSAEHYDYWRSVGMDLSYGAFGENLTVYGLTEAEACIGDTFTLGEAVVQVCQPRMPCYKVAAKLGLPDLPANMVEKGFSGFYLRVLQEGSIQLGDQLERVESHPSAFTIAEANRVVHHEPHDKETLRRLLEVDVLAQSWRGISQKRLDS